MKKSIPGQTNMYEEKVRLKRRIESINSELKALQEKLSEINRSL